MRNSILMGTLLALPLSVPALGQTPAMAPAAPDSWESIAGQVILHFVGGRSLEQAGGPAFNPYGIEVDPLLFALAAFFVTAEYTGEPVHEGEVAIFPQFATPRGGAFEASPETPAIIPFAMMKSGACFGGYVTGHPVPSEIVAVDMSGLVCHAAAVDEAVYALYAAQTAVFEPVEEEAPEQVPMRSGFDPRNPLDSDLDRAVWIAYGAAYALATAGNNYQFAPGGDFDALRSAMAEALGNEGLGAVTVLDSALATPDEARACAAENGTELRVALGPDFAGIAIVAASQRRMSSYLYDPDSPEGLLVEPARTCRTSGAGRVDTVNEP